MALREIVAFLGYRIDKQSETQARRSVDGIKKLAIGLVGAFGARALVRGLRNTVEEIRAVGDAADKASKRIGIGAEALQELQFAAGLAGASNADLETGLRMVAKNAAEAADGTKSFVDDFAKLGVTVTDSTGKLKDTETLFSEVGEGLRGLESDSQRLALAQTLVGRGGTKLIPFFNQGTDAINAQRKEARALGGVLGKNLVAQTAVLTDDMAKLDLVTQGLKATFAREFIPTLIDTIRKLIDVGGAMRENVGRAAGVMASAFRVLSRAAIVAARNLPVVLAAFGGLLILLSPMTALLLAVGAGILLVVDDFETMGEGGSSVIGNLLEEFGILEDETGDTLDAISRMLETAVDFWIEVIERRFKVSLKDVGNRVLSGLGLEGGFTLAPGQSAPGQPRLPGESAITDLGTIGGPVSALAAQAPVVDLGTIGGGGRGNVFSPQTTVEVTVNAETGASAEDIASASAKQHRAVAEDTNRLAFRSLVTP